MKSLSNYTEELQTSLFNQLGAFFAFSTEQFDLKSVAHVTYHDMGAGLICPVLNAKALQTGLEEIQTKGIAQDIEENGLSTIIERELANHEAYYTYDLDDTFEALEQYAVTMEQVQSIFHATKEQYHED